MDTSRVLQVAEYLKPADNFLLEPDSEFKNLSLRVRLQGRLTVKAGAARQRDGLASLEGE